MAIPESAETVGWKWEEVEKILGKEWGNMGHQPRIGKAMGKCGRSGWTISHP